MSGGFFVPENPALREPLTALDQIVTGLQELAGSAVVIAGAIGGLACLVLPGRRAATAVPLVLVLPALLPLSAFTAGHPFRIRYMVPLVAAVWALAGAAPGPAAEPLAIAGRGDPSDPSALIQTPPFEGRNPMMIEAQRERPLQRARETVTRYLAAEHDGSPILASMGSLGHYMQETASIGLSLRQFVHEGQRRPLGRRARATAITCAMDPD